MFRPKLFVPNPGRDVLTFYIPLPDKPLTRRGLLSITASFYDPLGFVIPVTLSPKKIQQQLCKMSLEWDECIPDKLPQEVFKWKNELEELSKVIIPRCFKISQAQNTNRLPSSVSSLEITESNADIELHTFCDASESAHGAVAYLKVFDGACSKVSFTLGKSRAAPIKTVTIPRLELTAAIVAAKMYRFIKEEIDLTLNRVYFWTGSQEVVRHLFNTSSRFKVFVVNRIQIIQEFSSVQDWHYVPTNLNPADVASHQVSPIS